MEALRWHVLRESVGHMIYGLTQSPSAAVLAEAKELHLDALVAKGEGLKASWHSVHVDSREGHEGAGLLLREGMHQPCCRCPVRAARHPSSLAVYTYSLW